MDVISTRGLTVRYGDTAVVDGLDLTLAPGRTLALLGPNGAGKTTTVAVCSAHRPPSAGQVLVLGEDPTTAGAAWRARIGLVPQDSGAFEHLTPAELLGHLATCYPDPLPVAEVLERLDLTAQADQRITTLSGGQHRRVDVACGILGRPELLFLDEPTTGLDPAARRSLWALLDDLGDLGTAVLLTSHHLEEVEALADEIVVLLAGRAVATGTPATLGGRGTGAVEVGFSVVDLVDRAGGPGALLGGLPDPEAEIHRIGNRVVVSTRRPTEVVVHLGQRAEAVLGTPELPDLRVGPRSLEDTYLRLLASVEGGTTEAVTVELAEAVAPAPAPGHAPSRRRRPPRTTPIRATTQETTPA